MRDWLCCSGNRQCTEEESQISLILYCVSLTCWQCWRPDSVCISDDSRNGVPNNCDQISKICFVVAVKWWSDVTDGQCKMYCSCSGSFWHWGQHFFNQGWYTRWLYTHSLINTVAQISMCCYFKPWNPVFSFFSTYIFLFYQGISDGITMSLVFSLLFFNYLDWCLLIL